MTECSKLDMLIVMKPQESLPLTFLHLSDIHFQKIVHEKSSLDSDLRNEIERDIKAMLSKFSRVEGVLISGDIAYSGAEHEYQQALDWLSKLCSALKVPVENVWCVPGNHDVDLSKLKNNEILNSIRTDLKRHPVDDLENAIFKKLSDKGCGEQLFLPFENYNKFAQIFSCNISPESPWWDYDFSLNDGSIFRLRGASTALLSDMKDNDSTNKLFFGPSAASANREDGVIHGIMAHHPFDWVLLSEEIETIVNSRCSVQIFGHKHSHVVRTINETSIRLSSGAVHPHRREPHWIPRYNWLSLSVETKNEQRVLKTTVFPRKWNKSKTEFHADYDECGGKEFKEYFLKVDKWDNPQLETAGSSDSSNTKSESSAEIEVKTISSEKESRNRNPNMNITRNLVYKFLMLNFVKQMQIVSELNLLDEKDAKFKGKDLILICIRRAEEKGVLESFSERINKEFDKK